MDGRRSLPVLPLRGFVIFPKMIINFDVGRKSSILAVEKAMVEDEYILLAVQEDAKIEEPIISDITQVGTIARIKQIMKLPNGVIRVLVEAVERAIIEKYVHEEPFFYAEVLTDTYELDKEYSEAWVKTVGDVLEQFAEMGRIAPDTVVSILSTEDPDEMGDLIAANLPFSLEKKIELLCLTNPLDRLEKILMLIEEEGNIIKLQKDIQSKVKNKINKTQKDYYLREQMKIIQDTLGDEAVAGDEINEYRQRLEEKEVPEYVAKKVTKEIKRLERMTPSSQESAVQRNYIEWVLDIPWENKSKEHVNIKKAEKILERDHYGLKKVKERILEHLSVREFAPQSYSPILCLVGPPGVGKTSIASSIAESLNREYVRISLGGVRDEAEIRGHRKTYVGAMPGRIISAIKQAGANNPLMLLDEIDKMSNDFRGDPTAALLEVLDPEQNKSFRDHYIELDFDLSDTLFLATANDLQRIPRPLRDRMEIIHLSSYTEDEKFFIAKKHLLSKQLGRHGLKKGHIRINDEALRIIINNYTKESGVRNLERKLAEIIRKGAKEIISGGKSYIKVTEKNIDQYLGIKTYRYDTIIDKADIGIARGLAWTSVGGDTLSVEVNTMKGKGAFQLTGQLGDVMKESAKAAMSYIRSRSGELGLKEDFYQKVDIHIHIPEGAVPKDGPSAGITMATAMISALTNIPVRNDVGMTGEITLRGRVLPIGGLKEKILAAKRAGIKTILVPVDNEKNVKELEEHIREGVEILFMAHMDEVLSHALTEPIKKVNNNECN